MRSQTWTPLPPPSPQHLSGSSPCTSPKHAAPYIRHGLAIQLLHDSIHVRIPILPNHPTKLFSWHHTLLVFSYLLDHLFSHFPSGPPPPKIKSLNMGVSILTTELVLFSICTRHWSDFLQLYSSKFYFHACDSKSVCLYHFLFLNLLMHISFLGLF